MGLPLKVLVLEDNPDDAELMLVELRNAGFDPRARCVDSEVDFATALEEQPDVILADFQLPRFDAMGALSMVRDRRVDAPFIIVSGTVSEEVAVECMKRGAADYLLKDRLARLGPAVRHALEARTIRRQQRQAEEARKRADARCRSLTNEVLESSPVGMFIVGRDLSVVWANRAAHRYFGLSPAEVHGADYRHLIRTRLKEAVEDGAAFERIVLATYEDNTYNEVFHCHVRAGPGRRERWLEHISQPITLGLYAGGRIEHYTDITDLKSAQQSSTRAGRESDAWLREAVEDLLAAAAHAASSPAPVDSLQAFRERVGALRGLWSMALGTRDGPLDIRELAGAGGAAITGRADQITMAGPVLTVPAGAVRGAARAMLRVIGEARRSGAMDNTGRLCLQWERAAPAPGGDLVFRLVEAVPESPAGERPQRPRAAGKPPMPGQPAAHVVAEVVIPLSAGL